MEKIAYNFEIAFEKGIHWDCKFSAVDSFAGLWRFESCGHPEFLTDCELHLKCELFSGKHYIYEVQVQ